MFCSTVGRVVWPMPSTYRVTHICNACCNCNWCTQPYHILCLYLFSIAWRCTWLCLVDVVYGAFATQRIMLLVWNGAPAVFGTGADWSQTARLCKMCTYTDLSLCFCVLVFEVRTMLDVRMGLFTVCSCVKWAFRSMNTWQLHTLPDGVFCVCCVHVFVV